MADQDPLEMLPCPCGSKREHFHVLHSRSKSPVAHNRFDWGPDADRYAASKNGRVVHVPASPTDLYHDAFQHGGAP